MIPYRILFFCILCGFFTALSSQSFATPYATTPNDSYTYGHVLEGHLVEHTFILENKGTSPLLIDKVDTGCGCILVSHPTEIAPGEKAPIHVKIVTIGYGGQSLDRKISVYTNDPTRRVAVYHIMGTIDKFAHISERKVYLSGKIGKPIEKTISITPTKKYPFTILGLQTGRTDIVTATLSEKNTSTSQKEYELHLQPLVKTPGKYADEVYLLTDHPLQKGISVDVFIDLTE